MADNLKDLQKNHPGSTTTVVNDCILKIGTFSVTKALRRRDGRQAQKSFKSIIQVAFMLLKDFETVWFQVTTVVLTTVANDCVFPRAISNLLFCASKSPPDWELTTRRLRDDYGGDKGEEAAIAGKIKLRENVCRTRGYEVNIY
eukprot:Seg5565.1 transcript_id=Seg5565.1/GoldUCD/mRNA.D3Y31 product="hypothetical protein" protein_id=Seg5565.1/GoldUCD/D3Y31